MTAALVSHVLHSLISLPLNHAVSENFFVSSCVKIYHHLKIYTVTVQRICLLA